MQQNVYYHKAAVIRLIEESFAKWENVEPSDEDLKRWQELGNDRRQFKSERRAGLIDTRNPDVLRQYAEKKLQDFLKEHEDNSTDLFIEKEVEDAKTWQSYFDKHNREDKNYYFMLQRWIDLLNSLSGSNGTPTPKKLSVLTNAFDGVPMKEVHSYFKKELVDKGYFSDEDLLFYLDYAFHKKQAPKKKFILKNVQSRQKINNIFGHYYRAVAGKPYGMQKQYAGLLGDYFEGFDTKNVSTNFS